MRLLKMIVVDNDSGNADNGTDINNDHGNDYCILLILNIFTIIKSQYSIHL